MWVWVGGWGGVGWVGGRGVAPSLVELGAEIVAELLRALWQYDLELIELSNPKLPPPSKKGKNSKKEL